MRLTRIELCRLAARIANKLPSFPEGSAERAIRGSEPAQHPVRAGAAILFAVIGSGATPAPQARRLALVRRYPDARKAAPRGGPCGEGSSDHAA
jgi:hypothetical protein